MDYLFSNLGRHLVVLTPLKFPAQSLDIAQYLKVIHRIKVGASPLRMTSSSLPWRTV